MARIAHVIIEPGTYLTSHEAADLIQMNPSTVNKWINEDRITAYRTPGGHRRISARDLVSFLLEYKMPVPAALSGVLGASAAQPTAQPAKKRSNKK